SKRFGILNFCGYAHVGGGEPLPSAGDFDAAVVAIAIDVDARVAGNGVGGHAGQRQLVPTRGGTMSLRHIASRIAIQQLQDGSGILLVGEESKENQVVVEATIG